MAVGGWLTGDNLAVHAVGGYETLDPVINVSRGLGGEKAVHGKSSFARV